jgi:hypothetical protein
MTMLLALKSKAPVQRPGTGAQVQQFYNLSHFTGKPFLDNETTPRQGQHASSLYRITARWPKASAPPFPQPNPILPSVFS